MSANVQTFSRLFSNSYEKKYKTMNLSEIRKTINLSEKNYINVRDSKDISVLSRLAEKL